MELLPIQQPREVTQEIYWLDEQIVSRLSSRNSKHSLSFGTKETYRSVIRDFNQFLQKNDLPVNDESLKRYFREIRLRLKPSTLNLRKYALLKCIKAQIGGDSITRTMII